jgi:dolichol-phosphate mannosyltransferase
MKVVNLIPTYNERENIGKLLESLAGLYAKNPKIHFLTLIVDDNSPDGTAEIVKEFQKRDKKSSIYLLLGHKNGLGDAMRRGIAEAIKLGADVIIPNEADFAYPLSKIPFIVQKIDEGYDFVVASRHVGAGKSVGWSNTRELNHFIANTLCATYLAGVYEVKDHNGALRGMRVKGVLDKIDLSSSPKGFAFINYLTFKMTQVTNKIYEFPVTYTFRTRGESKVSFNSKYIKTYIRDIKEYIIVCLRIRKERVMRV